MAYKNIKKIKYSFNLFSTTNMNNATAGLGIAASGVANILGAANEAELTKLSAITSSYANLLLGTGSSGDSYDDILADWQSNTYLRNVTKKEMGYKNALQAGAGALSGAATGASAGSIAGPLGAGIGAAVGGVTSLVGSLFGNNKAKKAAKLVNAVRTAINQSNLATLLNRVSNADFLKGLLLDAQPAAFGGSLYAFGGDVETNGGDFDTGVMVIGNGGTHELNPYGGVPMGTDSEGNLNLVEQDEVVIKKNGKPSEVLSNRVFIPANDNVRKLVKLPKGKLSYAEAAKHLEKYYDGRLDAISLRTKQVELDRLYSSQETLKQLQALRLKRSMNGINQANLFDIGGDVEEYIKSFVDPSIGKTANPYSSRENLMSLALTPELRDKQLGSTISTGLYASSLVENTNKEDKKKDNPSKGKSYADWLRYAPVVGSALNVLSDVAGLTNKPDYSNADMIVRAASATPKVSYTPLGNYLTYKPLDRDFYANKLSALAAATRANALNTSGGNRATAMANILATDYNAQASLGNLYRQAEEYNRKLEQDVATFNRGTDQYNSEASLKAQMANQSARSETLKGIMTAAQMRLNALDAASTGRSTNLTTLFDNLGNVGIDEANRRDATKRINTFASIPLEDLYRLNSVEDATYLAKKRGWTEEELKERGFIKEAKGGKLRTKTKRGLTF